MAEDWRKFEKLAARIEATLAPRGAVVRSPDKVPDLVTGSLREVDVSVRFVVGTVPILITVECRHRDAVQDDTWIEQLATKREKIGAAHTIAVSVSGFSEPAKSTARLKGIELRKLKAITDKEIIGWLRSVVLRNVLLHVKLKKISAELNVGGTYCFEPEPISGGIRGLLRVYDNQFVSPYEILNIVLRSNPLLLIPTSEVKTTHLIKAAVPPGMLKAQTSDGLIFVKSVDFEVDCWREVKRGSLSNPRYFDYAGPAGTIVQRAEFDTDVENIPFVLGLQVAPETRTVGVSISPADIANQASGTVSDSPESADKVKR